VEYKEKGGDVDAFVAQAVESIKGSATSEQPKDVVLYGFGRIGRILARLIISQSGLGRGLSLKAIVVRKSSDGDLAKRASLLRRDSI
ncbi:glyceraldehyde-3-phosphate dehydrogenase, partial [Acinetobacter baumannii]